MLAVPEEIKELFRQDNNRNETRRKWKLRFFDSEIDLLFPEDTLFPSDDLFPKDQEPVYTIENLQMVTETVVLTESLCDSGDLIFGECNAAQFEVAVADVFPDLTGKEFMVTVEVGNYEMAMGIYTVDSFVRQTDRRFKKITACDRMRKFQSDIAEWYQALTFPITLKKFRDSLCAYINIAQIGTVLPLDDMIVTKTIEPKQLYGLDVLQAICEINGCFGHIDKTGRLKYQFLPVSSLYPSEELFPDDELFPVGMNDDESEMLAHYKQSETKYEDYVVEPVEGVQIRQEEGDIGATYGSGKNCYVIQGNFLVYGKSSEELMQIASTVYDHISGRSYRPCKIVTSALPWVEVGDGLICHTTDDVIETYCLKRITRGIQGMMDTYQASGSIEREDNFGIQSQIIQLEGKSAVIKKSVEEVSVRVTDLKNYTEAQFKITAEEIAAEVKRAQEAEAALTIRADQIAMSVKDLKEETEASFKITAEEIAAEVRRAKEAEASLKFTADSITMSVKDLKTETEAGFKMTAEKIELKVSKGDVSSQLSIEEDQISLLSNRLIVDSTNFKLNKNGDAFFSGNVSGATITSGSMSGTSIDVGVFSADIDGVVVGGFYSMVAWGRDIFQSFDGKTGMSAESDEAGNLWFWAGWNDEDDFDFVVNNNGTCLAREFRVVDRQGFWKGWNLTDTMEDVYNRLSDLQSQIDNIDQGSDL